MAVSLELAISAIRAGRKEEGRQLLNLLIQQNPNNEMAWLWMSSVVNTDEQRARCLYHVLAINPDNHLARKGLNILGIVVTDSRPVKIPRDSQPIRIPNPSGDSGPYFPHEHQSTERRPFRIDPQSIVEELPFTPVSQPFAGAEQHPPPQSDTPPANGTNPAPEQVTPPSPADSQPVLPTPTTSPAPTDAPPAGQVNPDSAPHPPQTPAQSPSEPAPVVSPQPGVVPPPPPPAAYYTPGVQPPPMPISGQETRPTQPFQPAPQPPPGPAYGGHANITMGMPTQYIQPPPPSGVAPDIHSNMTMGMPSYPPAQYPVVGMQSGAAMALPGGYTSPGLGGPAQADYRQDERRSISRSGQPEEDEEDEVNILAVIIFGALSVTALGGLGMLILLMFTTG